MRLAPPFLLASLLTVAFASTAAPLLAAVESLPLAEVKERQSEWMKAKAERENADRKVSEYEGIVAKARERGNTKAEAIAREAVRKTTVARDLWAGKEKEAAVAYVNAKAAWIKAENRFPVRPPEIYDIVDDTKRIVTGVKETAKKLGWAEADRARLDAALTALGPDGTEELTSDKVEFAWSLTISKTDDPDLSKAADAVAGQVRPAVAQQGKNDCAVAAVATAAGLPYDTVAARAEEILGKAEWLTPYERKAPLEEVSVRGGFNGGETVMLAESLGQVEVVSSGEFAKVVEAGRPVMARVITSSGEDHEVVLTRAFQYEGKTWFEMADPGSPKARRFVSQEHLNSILMEKGIAFRSDP